MDISKDTKKTIKMIEEFLISLQEKEMKENNNGGEVFYSGHLGNMIHKLNLVKKELKIEE